jgi:hypothetical protein
MRRFVALGLLLAFFSAGCGSTGKFVYPVRMSGLVEISPQPLYAKKVAVNVFEDYRADQNDRLAALYLIPLMPYGWIEYDRPDSANGFISISNFEFTPAEDLAKSAATSLRRSNLFKDAYFSFGGEEGRADFILSGKIKSTYYKGRILSYGLFTVAPLFWLLGMPYGTSLNQLVIEMELRNSKGEKVWEYTFDKDDYRTQWIYARMGVDCKMYASLMQDGMNEAINDLAQRIKKNPEMMK